MSAECWSCHVPLEPLRPHRVDYDSEPEWLTACSIYLDFIYPRRIQQRERIREWGRLSLEADPVALRARMRELILNDDLTPEEDAELFRLIEISKTHRKARLTRKKA